jgi:septal ring factor EnvC (AmiA/AmiB activator)
MKKRAGEGKKIETKADALQERLASADAESKRAAANRIETRRKLDDLGKQLAHLKAEFELLEKEKARRQQ